MLSIILFSLFLQVQQDGGLIFLQSPYTPPARYLAVDIPAYVSSSPYDTLDRTNTYFSCKPIISYGVSNYFELSVSPDIYSKISAPPKNSEEKLYSALGIPYIETGIGVYVPFRIRNSKLLIGLKPSVTFCLDTTLLPKTERKLAEIGFGPLRSHNLDYNLNLYSSYNIKNFTSLLKIGYIIRGETYHSLKEYKSGLDFGLGMKYSLSPKFDMGLALIGNKNAREIFASPQISLKGSFGLLQLAVHIPTSRFDFVPDRELHRSPAFGIRYKILQKGFRETRQWVVKIVGEVVDSTTGEPLIANIDLYGPDNEWAITKGETGEFSFGLSQSGSYRVTAIKEGYFPLSKVVKLMSQDSVFCRFVLERLVDISITGRVLDAATGEPIAATVSLHGEKTYKTSSDSISGAYRFWAEVGAYNLTVEKKGYKKQVIPVYITNKTTIIMDVNLEIPTKKRRFLWW